MGKRAQGLPLSFIVLAAISVLILVIIVAFTVGGAGSFFRQIIGVAPQEIDATRDACRSNCDRLTTITGTGQWTSSSYCSKTYALDIDGDKRAGGYGCLPATGAAAGDCSKGVGDKICNKKCQQETNLRCWDSEIGIPCSVSFTTSAGTTLLCSEPAARTPCAETDCK